MSCGPRPDYATLAEASPGPGSAVAAWVASDRPWGAGGDPTHPTSGSERTMPVRPATAADAAADADLVQRVLQEHGLPFEPAGADADLLAPAAHYAARGGAFHAPGRPAAFPRRSLIPTAAA